MTSTISKLFDDHATASRAVGELEAAGVPRSEISIVASNADNWYASGDTGQAKRPQQLASIGTPMALTIARKGPAQEQELVRQLAALRDCSPVSA